MNRLVLSATLAERAALRFTPAGLPALDLVLAHESELVHEGQPRKVSMQLKALAIGSTVSAVASMPLGSLSQFVGFVAPARNGRGWIFHITEVHG
jgi:primosomal replication protein N